MATVTWLLARSQSQGVLDDQATDAHLRARCRVVDDLLLGEGERDAEQEQAADQDERPRHRGERFAPEDAGERVAEEHEPPDRDRHGEQPQRRREGDPAAHPGGQAEQPAIEAHRGLQALGSP